MSDAEQDEANMSAEESPHDDFDLQVILANFSLEPSKFDDILKAAKQFGDPHRFLINKFILEPTMSRKKMNYLFTKYVTTVKEKKHPEAFMKIQITSEESKELSRSIVKTMNTANGKIRNDFRPWRFVPSTDEKTPNEYVTMTGCSRNSSIISEASELTKSERALFLAILEEMMCGDGTVKMSWIHSIIQREPHKVPGPKCDMFMVKMTRQKYFSMDDDREIVEIAPRTIIELEPWLRAKFSEELKLCELCRRIISRPIYTAECDKCQSTYHFNCFKNATVISNQDSVECSKCEQKITLDEVNDQIVLKKAQGISRAPSRSATASRSRSASAVPDQSTSNDVALDDSDAGTANQTTVKEEEDVEEDDDLVMSKKPAKTSKISKKSTGTRKRVIVDSDSD